MDPIIRLTAEEVRKRLDEIGEYAASRKSDYTEADVPRLIKEVRAEMASAPKSKTIVSQPEGLLIEVHVRLLNEGTECSRPTLALPLKNGLFKLLASEKYDPEDESWEFLPGTVVRAERRLSNDQEYLLAVKR